MHLIPSDGRRSSLLGARIPAASSRRDLVSPGDRLPTRSVPEVRSQIHRDPRPMGSTAISQPIGRGSEGALLWHLQYAYQGHQILIFCYKVRECTGCRAVSVLAFISRLSTC